jgi:cyclohexadienyl dehydratase
MYWIVEEQDLKNAAIDELYLQNEFSKKVIRVGSPADYPPFAYINDNNEYEGLEVEIIRDIFDKLKVKFEFVKTTWSDLHADLLANKFDMAIGGISLTAERQKFLHSPSVMQSGKTLLTIRKYENSIKSFADIDKPGVIVVENRGGTNEQFAKMHIKNAKIVIVENNCEIFERLATGEFDCMFTDLPEALYRAGLDSRIVIAKPLQIYTLPVAYGFIYNHQSSVLRNCINIYVQKLVRCKNYNKY